MINNLKDQLRRDEGEVLHVYPDSKGIRTAGVGHNLEAHGIDLPLGAKITREQCEKWLDEDAEHAARQVLSCLTWAWKLDPIRLAVLINMAFNMGLGKLCEFKQTLELVRKREYDAAATEMLDSLWAKQVGERAKRLAEQMKTGAWK